jgi:hypothetical protein
LFCAQLNLSRGFFTVSGSESPSRDPFAMARLFTNHDPYHIHKTLGLFALMNFLLRFYYVARYGNSFPPEAGESKGFQCFCVLVHAALPAMSMFLPLPPKRNFWMPMI